ncbi:anthocyanidin 3-O-glucosyltransferase 5-like [Lycium ferocissimum]|uniref:anthocyanidin 3-O-glucosyltransferase 5-like n=1 Tax=Lycium ferocissimum TaxID=112874 RepID=UPI0028162950|nr:anthocyanidin 3-O-glucosyltransferase 5-like [Lycium ferocissimum]
MAIAEEIKKPHVAFLPSPGMGHITPLFEFAKRLVINHNFHVSFFVITTNASTAQNELFRPDNLPSDFHVIEIPPVENMSSFFTDDMRVLTQLAIIVRESLKHLPSLLMTHRPKALIIDLFCTDAFEICEKLEIPVYSFFTASTILMMFSLYLPTLDREVEGEFVDLPEPIQTPGCNPICPHDVLDQVKDRKNEEYKWYLLHVSRLPLAAGIFVNSWDDLEPVSLKALKENLFFQNIPVPPIHAIGPLIKQDEVITEKGAEILAWLDNQPPDSVLFVVFGSGGTLTSEQLTELAWGLEISQQRFILVARMPSDASASAAFFNVGSDENDPLLYLPEGFVKKTEGRGLVVPSWAPQVAILNHPSTGAFLSHCGWNSTLESIAHGVPMIAWPLYAEQRMNATILAEEVGVAMKFPVVPCEELISQKEIEKVVRIVMEGEKGKAMRRRGKELKESAKIALSKGGSSYESLCSVVQFWKSQ